MMLKKKARSRDGVALDRPLLSLRDSQHLDDYLTVRDLFENISIFGSTGTGKSSTVGYHLARNILDARKLSPEEKIGMIVFLYKTSDTKQWVRWAEEAGRIDDVILISAEDDQAINPLEAYRTKEPISAVNMLMVLSGIGSGGGSSQPNEPYWEQMNRQRLHRLILLAQLSEAPMTIETLYHLHSTAPQTPQQAASEDFRKTSYCWQMMNEAFTKVGRDHPKFSLLERYFVYEMPNMADRTQSSILSMTSAILEPFVSSELLNRKFCQTTNLPLDELLTGKIVLLDFPIQTFEYAGQLAQMMFKHILQKRIEERDLSVLPNPVCFWIDEYQHFISRYDPLFFSTARSSRAGTVIMTQNISNLFAQIGGTGRDAEERVNALLALTNHKIFLAQNNSITNEFASKTIGMGIHNMTNATSQFQDYAENRDSASVSESYHYQVMPRDFTMLARGGKHRGGKVESIITGTGKIFSNGKNYIRVSFKQPWIKS